MLKLSKVNGINGIAMQPPSGGCVLKPETNSTYPVIVYAATFGWLCVETSLQEILALL